MGLSEEQVKRYCRQIIIPGLGGEGQEKLLRSRVLLVGAGGLGSSCALYLAAAGVGTVGIVDSDRVELDNLQRQILHSVRDLGRSKVSSARDRLKELNPEVKVEPHRLRLTSENAMEVIRDYDIVVDGTDNFPTRYLLNDACVLSSKPLVHGAIYRLMGEALTILPGKTACYRCFFPEPPPPGLVPRCREAGVLGVAPGLIGTVQASEVLKYVLGMGRLLTDGMLVVNAEDYEIQRLKKERDPECAVCGKNPTITAPIDYEAFCRRQGKTGRD